MERSNWTSEDKQKLIELVRFHETIWNAGCPTYRELVHRKQAFSEIQEHFANKGYTIDEITSQWRNLKDVFYKKQAMIARRLDVGLPVEEPQWQFYKSLKFLLICEEQRRTLLFKRFGLQNGSVATSSDNYNTNSAANLGDDVNDEYEANPSDGGTIWTDVEAKAEQSSTDGAVDCLQMDGDGANANADGPSSTDNGIDYNDLASHGLQHEEEGHHQQQQNGGTALVSICSDGFGSASDGPTTSTTSNEWFSHLLQRKHQDKQLPNNTKSSINRRRASPFFSRPPSSSSNRKQQQEQLLPRRLASLRPLATKNYGRIGRGLGDGGRIHGSHSQHNHSKAADTAATVSSRYSSNITNNRGNFGTALIGPYSQQTSFASNGFKKMDSTDLPMTFSPIDVSSCSDITSAGDRFKYFGLYVESALRDINQQSPQAARSVLRSIYSIVAQHQLQLLGGDDTDDAIQEN